MAELEGEPHATRTDLIGMSRDEVVAPEGEAIVCIAHLTDLHVTDAQSPARFEFVNREAKDARFRELLPMHRPQETLNPHAIAAMVRAVNNVDAGPVTRGRLQVAVLTGDAIDNTQRNELTNFLALLNGGVVRPDSGAPGYEGVQLARWPGDIYWKPDAQPDADQFQNALGFPSAPGVLDDAVKRFESGGLSIPWLGCYGNHEEVCQGVGIVTPALADAMVGSSKPVELPPGIDRYRVVESFVTHPEQFMFGLSIEVPPDRERRPISRAEFIDAHFRSGGHGFTLQNCDDGVAYYVHDSGRVRFINLDTVCDAGGADGTIDSQQMHWLERRLEEVHSSFRSRDGSTVRTRNEDRYVVITSHHGYDTLSNPRGERRADILLELLTRFQNVVLWLNGHIHMNRIAPRRRARGEGGFWEVTTSALVDWPCQARLVELFTTGDGLLAIATTMLDHDGEGLAGLHRELAANVPFNGFDSRRPGTQLDRNAVLLLPAPF